MKTEKEKMISGEPYTASDKELSAERLYASALVYDYNLSRPGDIIRRAELLKRILGRINGPFIIEPPFHCDYGYNIEIGENFYSNYNLIILDCARVKIGDNVMLGPNVSLFTAGHPVHYETRNSKLEYAFPISIGTNVWIGGNVVVNPGISIGENTVIGAGSIVTRDLSANVIAAGNPCKIIRELTEEDKPYYFKKMKIL